MKEQPDYAIDIVSVSKRFERNRNGGYSTLKSAFTSLFSSKKKTPSDGATVTCAIDDLTIRIPKGASIGIIGKNGSGKSTLLKLITGIYKPDTGSISLHGRVAALIELGAGFHPDFTGRENMYLGGIIQGLTRKEIDERFDDIVSFAELEHVIDDPVRTYSSGMFMRLGFSLAVHTDPDVLLIDEVLAVGDAGFVSKCKEKITSLKKNGVTLLLVTHDMSAVERWSDEVLWLNEGVVRERGEPRRVIDAYINYIERQEEEELERLEEVEQQVASQEESSAAETTAPERWGSREVEILDVKLLDSQGKEHLMYHSDSALQIDIHYQIHQEDLGQLVFGIALHRSDGTLVFGTNTDIEGLMLENPPKRGVFSCQIDRIGFLEGNYHLDVAVHREDGYAFDYRKHLLTFAVRWQQQQVGIAVPPHSWSLKDDSGQDAPGLKEWQAHG